MLLQTVAYYRWSLLALPYSDTTLGIKCWTGRDWFWCFNCWFCMGQVSLFVGCDETELHIRKAQNSKAIHPIVTRKQQERESAFATRLVPCVPSGALNYLMALTTLGGWYPRSSPVSPTLLPGILRQHWSMRSNEGAWVGEAGKSYEDIRQWQHRLPSNMECFCLRLPSARITSICWCDPQDNFCSFHLILLLR